MLPARRKRVGQTHLPGVVERLDGRPLLSLLGTIVPFPAAPADLEVSVPVPTPDPGPVRVDLGVAGLLDGPDDLPAEDFLGVAPPDPFEAVGGDSSIEIGALDVPGVVAILADLEGGLDLEVAIDPGLAASIPLIDLAADVTVEASSTALIPPVDEVTRLVGLPPLASVDDLAGGLIGDESPADPPPQVLGTVGGIAEAVATIPAPIEVATGLEPSAPAGAGPSIEVEVGVGSEAEAEAVASVSVTPPTPASPPGPARRAIAPDPASSSTGPAPVPLATGATDATREGPAGPTSRAANEAPAPEDLATSIAPADAPTVVPQAPTGPARISSGTSATSMVPPPFDAPPDGLVTLPMFGPSPSTGPPASGAGTVAGTAEATGPAAFGSLVARGQAPAPAASLASGGRVVGRDSMAIRGATATPSVAAIDEPGDPSLAADLRALLDQFRSIAVGLHARLADGDPTSWILLAAIASVGIEVARRELGRGEGRALAEDDPDLLATWGLP